MINLGYTDGRRYRVSIPYLRLRYNGSGTALGQVDNSTSLCEAYDPDANRIEWLWRVSRRVVTHNHHRSDFALLLADVEHHF